jgi:hypothetical protein
MSNEYLDQRRIWATILFATTVTLAIGCQHFVDPYANEPAVAPVVTTPSADAVRAAQVEPRMSRRPYASFEVPLSSGAVTHSPLYFEDPFETPKCKNTESAWAGGDYLYVLYGPSRFLVNIALFPVSAVVTPPWCEMADDGLACRNGNRDASRDRSDPVDK